MLNKRFLLQLKTNCIDLRDAQLGPEDALPIFDQALLRNLDHLQLLDLSNCNLRKADDAIDLLGRGIKRMKHMKKLDLSRNGGLDFMKEQLHKVCENLYYCSALQT
jgi:hypothetical protein